MGGNSRRDDDRLKIEPVKNSDLACYNCIFKGENDRLCGLCYAYPNGKPGEILYGGPCYKKLTENDLEGMTAGDLDGWFD